MVTAAIDITPTKVEIRDAHFFVNPSGEKFLCFRMVHRGRLITQTIRTSSAAEVIDELVNGIGFEFQAATAFVRSCIMDNN